MSYAKNQRRKTVHRFKKEFGDKWQPKFREHIEDLMKNRIGQPIGTLQDLPSMRKVGPMEESQ